MWAYNGGLEQSWMPFCILHVQRKLQICPIIDICMKDSLFNDASLVRMRNTVERARYSIPSEWKNYAIQYNIIIIIIIILYPR